MATGNDEGAVGGMKQSVLTEVESAAIALQLGFSLRSPSTHYR